MEFPHWLMAAGACLVLFGSIGLAFRPLLRRLKRTWRLARVRWIERKHVRERRFIEGES